MTLAVTAAAAAPGDVAVSAQAPPSTSSASTDAARNTELTIVAFGDSLTSGHRLPEQDSYPAVLEKTLRDAGLPFSVVNHGVNGDTSAGGVRRLAKALEERPQILIVAFGANDGLRGVPVAQVRSNLEKIIEGAHAAGVKVLLVGMEALPLYGWQYTVDFHHIFPDLAAKYNVPLVPFMLNGVLGNSELMSRDGIHPNAAGARLIADNVWTELRPLAESLITATH
jgi:acyl-CoA thioesterase-1